MDDASDDPAALIARAAQYIRTEGAPFDQARLAALTGAPLPDPVPAVPTPQNADGGWPATWSAGASSLDATAGALDRLADLPPAARGPAAAAAVAFLVDAQSADGTWREGSSDLAPEYLTPGSAAARVYLTANCASILLVYEDAHPQAAAAVANAGQALEWSLDPRGRLPGPVSAHWSAARVLRKSGHELSARRLLDVVGRSFDQLEAHELVAFGRDTNPSDRWAKRIVARLATLQAPDGSWLDAEGKPSVDVTLAALRVAVHS